VPATPPRKAVRQTGATPVFVSSVREHTGFFAVQFSMKMTLELTRLALLASVAATLLLAGCATRKDPQQAGTAPDPVYESSEQIRAMPPCMARVVQRAPCSVYLTTVEGKGFYLGSPGSKADVRRFLGVLEGGKSYDLPDAFLKYQMSHLGTEP
jgi:hypothetical protein